MLKALHLGVWLFVSMVFVGSAQAQDPLSIPVNMVTHNVPALAQNTAARLQRYAASRGAAFAGWQRDKLLIYTRFAEQVQMHRVAAPMAYREQLTFLREPLSEVVVPTTGAKDSAVLLWDVGGSEFRQLFHYDLESGSAKMLSDGESLYSYVMYAPDEASIVYVTTARNGRNWDIHWQDFAGQQKALLETDDGYWYPIDWSPDGQRLLVKKRVSVNESVIYELDIKSQALRPVVGHKKRMSVEQAAYDGRGGIYFNADTAGEYLALYRLDLESGARMDVTQPEGWDIEGFVLSPDYTKLVYFVNAGGQTKMRALSLPAHQPLELPDLPTGVVTGGDFSPHSDRFALTLNSAISPSDVYVVDFATSKLTRWTKSEVGGLDTSTFVEPELITYTSFDGLEISAFLYRPQTPGPHPVVVSIHGGPEAQYRPYFSTTVQAYVNELKVAVIAPNVRGSKGYGRSFLKLDNGKLRQDSVKDIGALLDWIAQQDNLDAQRVAVSGGSYGGYMVLASMVHYGDRLAAAIDRVGISNFVTFLENTQAYRQDIRRVEYGDERDPAMRAFLEQISPLNHVAKMTTPLLIAQGANDPRVPASESEQMYQALSARGVPVWYLLAQDEGHSFRKKANADFRRVAQFEFLEKFLGKE